MSQHLSRLTLVPYFKSGKKLQRIPNRDPFSVMLNPETFTVIDGIEKVSFFDGRINQEFHMLKSSTFKLSTILLDATGAIPKDLWPKGCNSIKDMMDCLKKATIMPYGEAHNVPIIKIHWCGMSFTAYASGLKTDYTLFNVKGVPLRAEVTLDLVQDFSEGWPYEEYKSPDLTHLVEVKAGDTLPLMCNRIYNDPSYYLQIARINGLTNFRQIKPGMMLEFPPIRA